MWNQRQLVGQLEAQAAAVPVERRSIHGRDLMLQPAGPARWTGDVIQLNTQSDRWGLWRLV